MLKKIGYSLAFLYGLAACSSVPGFPEHQNLKSSHTFGLSPCPDRLNCVSTEADNQDQLIAPFTLKIEFFKAWPLIMETVEGLERTSIEFSTDGYVFAESRSLIFRFVDNLEILYLPDEQRLAVRSGALLGYQDFDVNRKRTEELRERLRAAGVIQ